MRRSFAIALTLILLVQGPLAPQPLIAAPAVPTDVTYRLLPFSQDWTDPGLITANDDWSGVPGITGYRGDNLTAANDVNPQTVLVDDAGLIVYVNANQTAPNTLGTGGIAEFAIADPVVALQGSGNADAPYLLIHLNTTGFTGIQLSYNLRDIDGSADNAAQQVALHYRVGATGSYTDVPAAYVADATTGPNLATLVTPVNVTLPAAADNQAQVQLRIMTTNASGNNEWVGIDDISVTGTLMPGPSGAGAADPDAVFPGDPTLLTVTVTPGTDPASTGLGVSADLTAIGGANPQSFYDDGTHGDATAGDNVFSFGATISAATAPGAKSLPVTITDAQARTGRTSIALTVKGPPVAIHTVQGAGHLSPLNGQTITLLPSIVTALRTTGGTRGFYLQDPAPDADLATSEGIFVSTGGSSNPASLVAVGDLVQVDGQVSEYRAAPAGLTLTELVAPDTISLISSGNPLPAPAVIGAGGRIPPATVIEDDASGSVETTGVFDPANDGIDFYESLEGMLVQVNAAVAVGPRSNFATNREIPVVGDNGANAGVRTNRGGVVAQATDYNPERIILNDWVLGSPILPAANVGDAFPGATVGVIDYSFNNFKLQVISLPGLVSGGLAQEVTPAAGPDQLAAATFNVENLAPTDPAEKYSALANLIITNLGSPDILSIEEIQDNNGTTNDAVVDAAATWDMLIAAIEDAGGPTYKYRQIDPVDDADGGASGGNIRVGFLFRTDRGLSFIDRPGATSTTANTVIGAGPGTHLQYSPGRLDPTNAAFLDSRKPLAGEFTFLGRRLFVIANHWNSKSGDQPLFGVNQPPTFSSEVQRNQQATVVHNFVNAILTADPNANVLVMGDLNDFQFSAPLATLKGNPAILTDLIETLPLAERYTYVFEGNSETLDHILASSALMARPHVYDVVHVNSEFAAQISDHEPQVLVVTLNLPPTADAGGPYTVAEGQQITLSGGGSDPDGDTLTYAWDLDNNGSYETTGQNVPFLGVDGPKEQTVGLQVCDDLAECAEDTATITSTNVPPLVTKDLPEQTVRRYDPLQVVTISAVDVPGDLMLAVSTEWTKDGSSANDGLPAGVTLTADACPPVYPLTTCTWRLGGVAEMVRGEYLVTLHFDDQDGGISSTTVKIVVPNEPPAADAGGPYTVNEGAQVVLQGAATDPEGEPLTYAWDLDNNGVFETAGQNPAFSAANRDGPATQAVALRVCDDQDACDDATVTITISNVAPLVANDRPSQSVQIPNPVAPVQVTYTDVAPDMPPASVATSWMLNGSAPQAGLPAGLAFAATVCTPDDADARPSGAGARPSGADAMITCTMSTQADARLAVGIYVVKVTVSDDDGGVGNTLFTITVKPAKLFLPLMGR